jgi:hypothetical protein
MPASPATIGPCLLIAGIAVAGCAEGGSTESCFGSPVPEAAVEIGVGGHPSPEPVVLLEGSTIQLSVTLFRRGPACALEPDNPPTSVVWTVSAGTTAKVHPNGMLHALAGGSVTVEVAVGNVADSLHVRVEPMPTLPPFSTLVAGHDQTCAGTPEGEHYCWGRGIPLLCTMGPSTGCVADFGAGWDRNFPPGNLLASCLDADTTQWHWGTYVMDGMCSRVPSRVSFPTAITAPVPGGPLCGLTATGVPHCAALSSGYGGVAFEPVPGSPAFVQLAVGETHMCGLDGAGVAYCWGEGGALGDGTEGSRTIPTPVSGDVRFVAIRAGYRFTCAIATDGRAFCWGTNVLGQAGPNANDDCDLSELIHMCGLVPRAVSDTTFEDIVLGFAHACAVTADGRALCWGDNLHGTLGDGTTAPRPHPLPVQGGLAFWSLVAGGSHTCGISRDGAAYCWGEGVGATTSSVPVAVGEGPQFTQLAAGRGHTCGLTGDGVVYCWGWNQAGQLGTGRLGNEGAPARILGH